MCPVGYAVREALDDIGASIGSTKSGALMARGLVKLPVPPRQRNSSSGSFAARRLTSALGLRRSAQVRPRSKGAHICGAGVAIWLHADRAGVDLERAVVRIEAACADRWRAKEP